MVINRHYLNESLHLLSVHPLTPAAAAVHHVARLDCENSCCLLSPLSSNRAVRLPKYSNTYTGGTITNCAFKSLWVSKGWVDPRLSESKSILSIWKNKQLKNCLEFAVIIRVLSEGQHGVVILNTDPRVPTRPVSKIGKSAKGSATKAIGPLPPQRGIGASSFGTGKRLPGHLPLETLATSPRGLTSHPSGISPSSESTSRSGKRS